MMFKECQLSSPCYISGVPLSSSKAVFGQIFCCLLEISYYDLIFFFFLPQSFISPSANSGQAHCLLSFFSPFEVSAFVPAELTERRMASVTPVNMLPSSCCFCWQGISGVGLSEHRPFCHDVNTAFASIYQFNCSCVLGYHIMCHFFNHYHIDLTQHIRQAHFHTQFKPILIFLLQISVLFWQMGVASHFTKNLSILFFSRESLLST